MGRWYAGIASHCLLGKMRNNLLSLALIPVSVADLSRCVVLIPVCLHLVGGLASEATFSSLLMDQLDRRKSRMH